MVENITARLSLARVKAIHPYAYKPNGCKTATITGIAWDNERHRAVVFLHYDNHIQDWIPLSEINDKTYCFIGESVDL